MIRQYARRFIKNSKDITYPFISDLSEYCENNVLPFTFNTIQCQSSYGLNGKPVVTIDYKFKTVDSEINFDSMLNELIEFCTPEDRFENFYNLTIYRLFINLEGGVYIQCKKQLHKNYINRKKIKELNIKTNLKLLNKK